MLNYAGSQSAGMANKPTLPPSKRRQDFGFSLKVTQHLKVKNLPIAPGCNPCIVICCICHFILHLLICMHCSSLQFEPVTLSGYMCILLCAAGDCSNLRNDASQLLPCLCSSAQSISRRSMHVLILTCFHDRPLGKQLSIAWAHAHVMTRIMDVCHNQSV